MEPVKRVEIIPGRGRTLKMIIDETTVELEKRNWKTEGDVLVVKINGKRVATLALGEYEENPWFLNRDEYHFECEEDVWAYTGGVLDILIEEFPIIEGDISPLKELDKKVDESYPDFSEY